MSGTENDGTRIVPVPPPQNSAEEQDELDRVAGSRSKNDRDESDRAAGERVRTDQDERDRAAGERARTPTGPAFIYMPSPPEGWHRIRVRTIHDVMVIFAGMFCLLSQALAAFLWNREPQYWIIAAGLTCLGYGWAVRHDRQANENGGKYEPHRPD